MSNKEEMKLVPRLRFPEFKGGEAWSFANGNILFDQISNKNHNSDLPILAITQEHGAIPRNEIDYNVTVTEKSIESYKVVEVGDFIISLRSFQGGIEYSRHKGLCSPAYVILRKRKDVVDDFFKHYFKTNQFIQDLNKNLEGLRDGKMVSYKQFSELFLPEPSSAEQQKIADCLSSLDELVAAECAKLEALKAHKKGLMQQLFPAEGETVPALRFAGFEGEWEEKKLGAALSFTMGNAFKSDDFLENGIQLVRMGNLYQGELQLNRSPVFLPNSFAKGYSQYLIRPLDLLMSMTGTLGKRDYGFVIQVPANCPALLLNQRVLKITPKLGYNKEFVLQLLKNETFLEKLYSIPGGTKQANLSSKDLSEIQISFPKFEEQQKIADCLAALDELITAQTERLMQLKQHKKGLMQGLFPSCPNKE